MFQKSFNKVPAGSNGSLNTISLNGIQWIISIAEHLIQKFLEEKTKKRVRESNLIMAGAEDKLILNYLKLIMA